ncbi:hypothetical protein GQX73_g2428 [Xylaria multiplex]|uniref:Large ribosomal subunit protein uL23m n=1 Tax=Xylaria multiplex TaxID=323545 RepID=A0A7C8N1V9_9PEZI|nr:hypothetical protein GQX73_g2428 [Xylaria multiplex]
MAAAGVAAGAAGAAAEAAAGGLLKTFRTGNKQVFLPSHMVTFLAPRANQPPTFATFKVPLTFNKFDLRDYLLHAYKTPVLGVRSQLRQQRVRKSPTHGRIYRPPPIKTMTVQLTQPFVWPRLPTDTKPWRKPSSAKAMEQEKSRYAYIAGVQKLGRMPLRDEMKESQGRKDLKKEAKRLLKEGGWTNKRDLDPRFSEKGGVKKS